jgi:hypothetical protein
MSQLRADTNALLEHSKTLQERVVSLEKKLLVKEIELSNHKALTQFHFESNWRSLARMNNNFKALGHGFLLEKKDLAPEEQYAKKEE